MKENSSITFLQSKISAPLKASLWIKDLIMFLNHKRIKIALRGSANNFYST